MPVRRSSLGRAGTLPAWPPPTPPPPPSRPIRTSTAPPIARCGSTWTGASTSAGCGSAAAG
ncbi:MAG: hypothetical protein E6G30_01600 [Actinobacteria bacterium]|nr:MAG: hypothetical protein E6G30_01600 [Actinomycetota bacterium]